MAGLSKISVQSGTSHGGVVLADGSIADVKLDLDTLETLSKVARDDYGLAGAVQHGASTLPDTAFHNFPEARDGGDSSRDEFPEHAVRPHAGGTARRRSTSGSRENAKDERKATDSDEQFFYKTRKKAIGPFKRQMWDLPDSIEGDAREGVRREVRVPVQSAGDRQDGGDRRRSS